MDTIEQVGAVLGVVAFLALVVLALMYFQQAREVRRLREWAGRAPERAAAEAERQRELDAERAAAAGEITHVTLGARLLRWSRRLPVDPLYVLAGVVGLLIAVGIVTGGYGLLGSESGGGKKEKADKQGGRSAAKKTITVAVLNATQEPGVPAFPGVADAVGQQVEDAGFKLIEATDSPVGFAESSIMYAKNRKQEAQRVEKSLESSLGSTKVEPMSQEIADALGGQNIHVAVVVGLDDTEVASGETTEGATTTTTTTTPTTPTTPGETLTP